MSENYMVLVPQTLLHMTVSYEARRYVPLSTEDLIILYRKEIEVVSALQNLIVIISDLKVTGMGVEENYLRQCP